MIIVALKGGLGNQLFQYAAGRALSLKNKDSLKLDVGGYGEHNGIDTVRRYSLAPFNIRAELATGEEARRLKYPHGIFTKGMRFVRAKLLRQFNVDFIPSILEQKGDVYLDGFFQTEKYFKDVEGAIRQDLTLKKPLGEGAAQAAEAIKAEPSSVSLHVRRGDYVHDPKTNRNHGVCGPDYYEKAVELMKSKVGNGMRLFVFSDEIGWVRENMQFPCPAAYVSSPSIPDYEEMNLMSLCRHNIIANSSFSWWGAWLNSNPNKVIIAPKQWTRTGERRHKDIAPENWIRM